MDNLPELPFEQILGYLSLVDRLKCRIVSRGWRMRFDFALESLCYSKHPRDFILGKSRLVSGLFAQNFVSSARFEWFFNTFGASILSNLKQLRLCDLRLNAENRTAFAPILQSFGQLEQLDLIRVHLQADFGQPKMSFELNLPTLKSIRLEELAGIEKLTVDAPRLARIQLLYCESSLRLDIVQAESVEKLITSHMPHLNAMQVKNMKNLEYLYCTELDSSFLSDLKQLKEIHLKFGFDIPKLFDQKQLHGLADLKISFNGLFLDGPDDLPVAFRFDSGGPKRYSDFLDEQTFANFARNLSRLIRDNPLYNCLYYTTWEPFAPGVEIDVLSRFPDLNQIIVNEPVYNVERFLNFLRNCDNLAELRFWRAQSQVLFNRLPEYCAVQVLAIRSIIPDFQFLFRLKHLVSLEVRCPIDAETIRKVLEELPFLSQFIFMYKNKELTVQTVIDHPNQFVIFVGGWVDMEFSNLNAAFQFIDGTRREESPSG